MSSVDYSNAISAPTTRVTSRVDIYESDAYTPYLMNAELVDGSVSLSQGQDTRRTFSLVLRKDDAGMLDNYPGGFWYDKVIKPYRGVVLDDGTVVETRLGEFVIDEIATTHFPPTVSVSCRDYSKTLLNSKFLIPTAFAAGQPMDAVIKAIALNGGIDKFIISATGKNLGREYLFDRNLERWTAMTELATAFGYEVFFDNEGYLRLQEFRDPVTSPTSATLQTGATGNLASYSKKSSDSRIYNIISVEGQSSGELPVYAEARNTEPSSPTRIEKLGERVYEYTSSFITTALQAQDVADKFLKVHALESFDLDFASLVFPWLDVGTIVEFVDPDPSPGDPTRFLLSSLTIPLKLGPMTGNGKRITVVG